MGKSTFIESFGCFLVEQRPQARRADDRPHQRPFRRQHPGRQDPHGAAQPRAQRLHPPLARRRTTWAASPGARAKRCCFARRRVSTSILVETVGVGQSEIALRSMVDFFLLLLLPGRGRRTAGHQEGHHGNGGRSCSINKADGDNRLRAEQARAEQDAALHYLQPATPGWKTEVGALLRPDRRRSPEALGADRAVLPRAGAQGRHRPTPPAASCWIG